MADALGARTAWVPAHYWIGRRWPVLPEYSFNAIHKIKYEIELTCPIVGLLFSIFPRFRSLYPYLIEIIGVLEARLAGA
ncbi:hypothetical protein ICY20_18675 [Pseudomonas sp. P115]|uniref:hypothetical protein n=1 Tax=Pseudomonas pisciculturae TaxID=2730413 RepID=UPI00189211D7|nr:hypothetical protein [Pseudomonas pisciculturae]MBF6029780.1 hypothetical protein [Pseudomonas pisciculturae]